MDCVIRLNDIIKSAKNILIVSHINPDGDTLGSMCALYSAVKDNFKKRCDMVVLSKVPRIYEFLPNVTFVKNVNELDRSLVYDLVICVDVAAQNRFEEAMELFNRAHFTINIDHHKTNTKYADLNIIDSNASSAGEFLYKIMRQLEWEISKDTATALYTAVLTDTGSFRFSNTTCETFKVAGELCDIGVDTVGVYKNCYENNSKNMIMFQAYCVSNAKFVDDDKVVYSVIYKKDLEKFSAGEDATEGLAEKLRAIETTKVSFIVKELGNRLCKVSMRSKDVDVAEVCAVFGGGGHTCAAGCVVKSSVQATVKKILMEIRKQDF